MCSPIIPTKLEPSQHVELAKWLSNKSPAINASKVLISKGNTSLQCHSNVPQRNARISNFCSKLIVHKMNASKAISSLPETLYLH